LSIVAANRAHLAHGNPLNAELNPICHLLALLRDHHILHVGRIRVKRLTSEHPSTYIKLRVHRL